MAKPRLEVREKTLILFVDYHERQRAKNIQGYQWNIIEKGWMYPKTKQIYNEIVAEFGDEIDIQKISKGQTLSEEDGIGVILKENTELLAAISSLKSEITNFKAGPGENGDQAQAIIQIQKLAAKDEELSAARRKIEELNVQNKTLSTQLAETDNIISELRRSLETSLNSSQFFNLTKELAIDATGGDSKFKNIINEAKLEAQFVYLIFNKCIAEIKTLLSKADIKRPENAAEIISIARDTGLIPVDAAHLAHFIRSQRNALAHNENLHPKTINARVLACLFVAALLWPEFPE